jgi:hypothetical protein
MPDIVPNTNLYIYTHGPPVTDLIIGVYAGTLADGQCILTGRDGVGAIEPHLNHVHVLFSTVNFKPFDGVPLEVSLAYGGVLMGFMSDYEKGIVNKYDGQCGTQLAIELDPLDYAAQPTLGVD